ncbi:MAG: hypothetical protein JWQ97_296 [Phenylobacterium sp.]|nr:hypothetical protein [Phenylobacterium sp.]
MSAVRWLWREGAHVRLDANKAGREMEDIRRRNGDRLTPEAVLERARSANSALHEHFEWDNDKAAEQHRLGQAGELIRSIQIDVSKSNLEIKPIRAFVNVQQGGSQHYTSTVHALSDAELRAQVLAKAWDDLEAWRRRHAELTEFAKIFASIDEARVAIKGSETR